MSDAEDKARADALVAAAVLIAKEEAKIKPIPPGEPISTPPLSPRLKKLLAPLNMPLGGWSKK